MSKEELDNITDFIDSQPTKKTNGKRNRTVGNNLERQIVKDLKPIYPNITTSRNNSRLRDASGVDLMNADEAVYGRLSFNIQAKCLAKHADYTKILSEMPQGKEVNVVIHKKTKKNGPTGKFISQGTYAILAVEDFYSMLKTVEDYKVLVAKINTMV